MRYDDRLATVLRLPIHGQSMARVQLTQLLDLLGAAPAQARGDLLDAAYLRLTALCQDIPGHDIAAMLGQPGLRLRSPRLVACLCQTNSAIAKASLHSAQLDENAWMDLIPAMPPACWSLLWQRRDLARAPRELLARLGAARIALPPAAPPEPLTPAAQTMAPTPSAPPPLAIQAPDHTAPPPETAFLPGEPKALPAMAAAPSPAPAMAVAMPNPPAPTAAPPVWQHHPDDGIGAIVRRIEAFRRAREAAQRDHGEREAIDTSALAQDAPRLPLGEAPPAPPPIAFDIETDHDGCIIRADASVAPMVVGMHLADIAPDARGLCGEGAVFPASAMLAECIGQQQPIRSFNARLAGGPAIAGAWQLDAIPHFDMLGGRFVGYLGRFRRLHGFATGNEAVELPATTREPSDSLPDRLRQSLHELRTPVNAIQGFAEIIQQQLFGPTPHEYRALAAAIAADAARMLAGFEELERLARIDTGAIELASGASDLADSVCATLARLEHHAASRDIALELDGIARPMPISLAEIETERLCWRLLATLVGAADTGESLSLHLARHQQQACLSITLPAKLAALVGAQNADSGLFHASVPSLSNAASATGPSAGMFGTGFALRLARAEARSAGGSLTVEGLRLCLRLPGLTESDTGHSVELRGEIS